MDWRSVGAWVKQNAGPGAALIGSLLTGNVPGAVAAGAALVSSATGTADPTEALVTLQQNPTALLRLRELAQQNEQQIREHLQRMTEMELKDRQAAHHEQQETIRAGDEANDTYVRRTRPRMARQSWTVTAIYIVVFELLHAFRITSTGASWELASVLAAPALAYLGFRTADKFAEARKGLAQVSGR